MNQPSHHGQELWFRPSPMLPFAALFAILEKEKIIATPRLGKRDGTHPKGYVPGTVATLRLFDDDGRERLRTRVRIDSVLSKPLRDFAPAELAKTAYKSADWRLVQQALSFFEGRPVAPEEIVSIVGFTFDI